MFFVKGFEFLIFTTLHLKLYLLNYIYFDHDAISLSFSLFLKHLEKMKSWLLVRVYPENLIESEIKNVKFVSKNRNNNRGKSLKAVPFVMIYHPKLKSTSKVILKYLDLLYMDDEVTRVFTPKSEVQENVVVI